MIRKIYLQNFRVLRANVVPLAPFQVLAGPNDSGKSTLLAAIRLVSAMVSQGLAQAVRNLAPDIRDLCFDPTRSIAIALEIVSQQTRPSGFRFEVEIGSDPAGHADEPRILREQLFVVPKPELFDEPPPIQPSLFETDTPEPSVIHERTPRGWHKVVAKSAEGKDSFWDENTDWHTTLRFGIDRSALGSVPEDPDRFPTSLRARDFFRKRIGHLALDLHRLRSPCRPCLACTAGTPSLNPDGSNLPCAVRALRGLDPERFREWFDLVQTVFPELIHIDIHERTEDRMLQLVGQFRGERTQPVACALWADALLRFMALTLIRPLSALVPDGVCLIDEPETGLDRRAIHAVFRELSARNNTCQIICATHSLDFTSQASPDQVHVFRRTPEGAAHVIPGAELEGPSAWLEPG